ncbi:aldo/keto reductase [Aquimarina megaterium]|uniref:aldo/keto reductase n=1 Tax=Aquimarina megaterium TaxID=1443666 RepID=UPI000945CC9C|nr:aldo/keto reductase [Aquimarina megaterium]
MKFKKLGNSGLKVSSLCLGTMTFGDGADENTSKQLYKMARNKGINFFDCANVYGEGKSEKILGKLIHEHRDEVIITTKAYYPTGKGVNENGLSKKHLTIELEESLKRLNTDYIDVYYLHCFDTDTPLEESLSTLNNFVKQGKIFYVGLSNFAAWQVMKAISITKQLNTMPISCIQPMYNLLKRQCESEILPMAMSEKLGVASYSPLGGGMLTGKYQGKNLEGRLKNSEMYQKRYLDNENDKAVNRFIKFAKDNNYNPVSLAIAWVSSHPAITAPIIGARNMAQLEPALASLDFDISAEIRNELSSMSLAPEIATDRSEEE